MMKAILEELIQLNVALEGSLRVALQRESPEALSAARQNLDRINTLFASLDTPAAEAAPGEVKDEEAVEAETTPPDEPDSTEVPAAAPVVETDSEAEAVAVDEMLSRRECRDLRKAFTLNDKFLFRRELFGGSEQEFSDTLDLLTAMNSLDEAKEYLYDDLQWDPKNEVVKDFMDIVTNHFKSRTA